MHNIQPGLPSRLSWIWLPLWLLLFLGAPGVGATNESHADALPAPIDDLERSDVTPREATIRREVAFLEPERSERLDLYLPSGHTAEARAPAVVWIHGGGWTGGSKAARRERNVCTVLASERFVCASIDYKLGDGAWPQNLLDAKNAVRFLRTHAAELGVDPDRIAIAGASAGAHLALMAAYTAGLAEFEPAAPYPDVSSAVCAVIDFYGPANLRTRRETESDGTLTDKPKLGGPLAVFGAMSPDDPVFRRASPVSYVRPQSPPTLILHGRADATVDYTQSEEFARVLTSHGVPHELVLLDGVGHTFDFDGWNHHPLPRDARTIVVEFMNRHLR